MKKATDLANRLQNVEWGSVVDCFRPFETVEISSVTKANKHRQEDELLLVRTVDKFKKIISRVE